MEPTNRAKTTVTVTLDDDFVELLDAEVERTGVSRSTLAAQYLLKGYAMTKVDASSWRTLFEKKRTLEALLQGSLGEDRL